MAKKRIPRVTGKEIAQHLGVGDDSTEKEARADLAGQTEKETTFAHRLTADAKKVYDGSDLRKELPWDFLGDVSELRGHPLTPAELDELRPRRDIKSPKELLCATPRCETKITEPFMWPVINRTNGSLRTRKEYVTEDNPKGIVFRGTFVSLRDGRGTEPKPQPFCSEHLGLAQKLGFKTKAGKPFPAQCFEQAAIRAAGVSVSDAEKAEASSVRRKTTDEMAERFGVGPGAGADQDRNRNFGRGNFRGRGRSFGRREE